MAKILQITFNFEGRKAPTEEINKVLNKALSWVAYAPNCWMIFTSTEDANTWYTRLRKVVNRDDSVFVCELNIENRQGWLPRSVWKWIDEHRSKL
jgi:hypothetical protein